MSGFETNLILVGGPTVLIEIGGFRLLTDPTFDTPRHYLLGAVALEKTAGPALLPEEVGAIDAVLLSHDQHVDNLDHAGRALQPGDAIYVTGDTVWYEGTAEVARQFSPSLVIVFAGSAEPRGRFHLTMDSNDVIETAHAFPEASIVAVHNHGWAHFKESEADLAHAMATLGVADRLRHLSPGVPATFAF